MADKRIPKRLGKEPLLEAVWEIRFNSDKTSLADLLPGLIYSAFPNKYQKIEKLAASNIPSQIRQQDPSLRYVPIVKLEDLPYAIQIGDYAVSLSCRRPYSGWENFKSTIFELAEKLRETGLLGTVERFSLKYIDIIPVRTQPSLDPLDIDLKLGALSISNYPVQLRTEIAKNSFIHIVQIVTPAKAMAPTGESFEGVLFDIDTIYRTGDDDFWRVFSDNLANAHTSSKQMFFDLLKDDTIEQLEPEY